MFEIKIDTHSVRVYKSDRLTSGSIGLPVKFSFCSDEWSDLTPTVKFVVGDTSMTAALDTNKQCAIPWELLSADNVGKSLSVGVCGIKGTTIVFPTIYTDLGIIQLGADATGDTSAQPTPSAYAEFVAQVTTAVETVGTYKDTAVSSAESAATSESNASASASAASSSASAAALSATSASQSAAAANTAKDTAVEASETASAAAESAAGYASQVSSAASTVASDTQSVSTNASAVRINANRVAALTQTASDKASEATTAAAQAKTYLDEIKALMSVS